MRAAGTIKRTTNAPGRADAVEALAAATRSANCTCGEEGRNRAPKGETDGARTADTDSGAARTDVGGIVHLRRYQPGLDREVCY